MSSIVPGLPLCMMPDGPGLMACVGMACCRHLMPKLVLAPGQAGWPHLERLLVALLRFLEPYLRNADLTDAIRNLYKVPSACFMHLCP